MLAFFGIGVFGALILGVSGVAVERAVSRVGKVAAFITFVLIPFIFALIHILFSKVPLLICFLDSTINMVDETTLETLLESLAFSQWEVIMIISTFVLIGVRSIFVVLYNQKKSVLNE